MKRYSENYEARTKYIGIKNAILNHSLNTKTDLDAFGPKINETISINRIVLIKTIIT